MEDQLTAKSWGIPGEAGKRSQCGNVRTQALEEKIWCHFGALGGQDRYLLSKELWSYTTLGLKES